MLWLQSKKRFQDVAKYDFDSGKYEVLNRNCSERPESLDGSFEILSGIFIALFKMGLKLYIGIGGKYFEIDNELTVSVKGNANSRILVVEKGNVVLESVSYSLPNTSTINGDTTAFIDDEDSDYGTFVVNICKDKSRQRVLLGLE
jgi:hypothetical protein